MVAWQLCCQATIARCTFRKISKNIDAFVPEAIGVKFSKSRLMGAVFSIIGNQVDGGYSMTITQIVQKRGQQRIGGIFQRIRGKDFDIRILGICRQGLDMQA